MYICARLTRGVVDSIQIVKCTEFYNPSGVQIETLQEMALKIAKECHQAQTHLKLTFRRKPCQIFQNEVTTSMMQTVQIFPTNTVAPLSFQETMYYICMKEYTLKASKCNPKSAKQKGVIFLKRKHMQHEN